MTRRKNFKNGAKIIHSQKAQGLRFRESIWVDCSAGAFNISAVENSKVYLISRLRQQKNESVFDLGGLNICGKKMNF